MSLRFTLAMARRDAAVQAFYEWMPIREDAASLGPRIYRTLRWGDLADLIMLDTRLVGRDEQASSRDDVAAIKASPLLRKDVPVSGFVYEVETGRIRRVA